MGLCCLQIYQGEVKDVAVRKGWDILEFCFAVVKKAFYAGAGVDAAFDALQPSHCGSFFAKSMGLRGG